MNFIGHALLATRRSRDPAYVLGAMLPDLANMAGLRIERVEHERMAAGVDFHHRCDDAFHGAPLFVGLMGKHRDLLEERGLQLGPAMAIGHVGVELLLDGWLVTDPEHREVVEHYRRAMALAHELGPKVVWRKPERAGRWQVLVDRLDASELPEGYADPGFVAQRLLWILESRPRLAVAPERSELVFEWARQARPEVVEQGSSLLEEVEGRL